MKTRLLAGSVASLVLVFAAACGSGGGGTGPTAGQPGQTPRPAVTAAAGVGSECNDGAAEGGTVIELTDYVFPDETRVAVGESITWINNDVRTHTVTFRGGPNCNHLLIGASKSIQFNNPGTFDYLCQFHDNMRSKVIVE